MRESGGGEGEGEGEGDLNHFCCSHKIQWGAHTNLFVFYVLTTNACNCGSCSPTASGRQLAAQRDHSQQIRACPERHVAKVPQRNF